MQLCKYRRSLTYGIWYGCNIKVRVSALIVCVCLFVCVSALIICKSSESTGECVRVCSSLVACCVFEMYRRTRDLLEPDLLDLETLYKASHFYVYLKGRVRRTYLWWEAGGMRGIAVAGALMESVGFHCRTNDVRNWLSCWSLRLACVMWVLTEWSILSLGGGYRVCAGTCISIFESPWCILAVR